MSNFSQSTLGLVRDALELTSPETDEFNSYTIQRFWKNKLFDVGFPPQFIGIASSIYSFDWTEIMLDLCSGEFGAKGSNVSNPIPQDFYDLMLEKLVVFALAESQELASDLKLREALEADHFDFSLANLNVVLQKSPAPLPDAKPQSVLKLDSISRPMGAVAIFISHSSQDQHLADALTELLKNAMEIDPQAIRCTIVEGHGLPAGVNSGEQLKEELLGAKSFIALLTPHSLSSTWVLFEMGARWGKGLKLIPILAAGLTHKQLGGPLPDIHAISCESDSDLHKLVRILSDGTGATLRPAEFYSRYLAALQNKSRDLARTHDSSGQKAKLATIGQPDSSARLKPAPHIIQLPARSAWVRIDDFCYRETKEAFTRAVIAVYENEVQDSEKIGDVQYVAGKIICSDEHGQELSELRVNQGCWMNAGNEVNFLPNTRHELIIAIKEQRQYQILREAFKYGSVRNTQFAHEKLFVTVQLIAKNEVLRTDRYLLKATEKEFSLTPFKNT